MSVTQVRTYIYQKPHRSGRTTWTIKWLDPDSGVWCYHNAGQTQSEAKLIEARVREALFRGESPFPKHSDEKRITVDELIDLFYKTPRFLNAASRWQAIVKAQFETVIRPSLGKKPFAALKRDEVYNIYLKLKNKGLSHSTILKYHRKLTILGQLFSEYYPGHPNPVLEIRDFSRLFPKQAPTRDINFLTPEELEKLYEALAHSRSGTVLPLVKFLAHSGLRRSEALSLRWSDIDESSGFIQIRTSKNGSARRVPLEPGAKEALEMLPKVNEIVFTKADGSVYHKDSFLKPLKRAAARAKINKRIDIHSLRHSWGSNKIRAGWGIRKVSQMLGHSDIFITSEVYTHLLDGDLCVRDQFHFDKKMSSANIVNRERLENVSNFVEQILLPFANVQDLAALKAYLSSFLQNSSPTNASSMTGSKGIQTPSQVSESQEAAMMARDPQFSPHVLRRGHTGACDPVSVAGKNTKLSSDINDLKWCARYESNVRPSASEADALSN